MLHICTLPIDFLHIWHGLLLPLLPCEGLYPSLPPPSANLLLLGRATDPDHTASTSSSGAIRAHSSQRASRAPTRGSAEPQPYCELQIVCRARTEPDTCQIEHQIGHQNRCRKNARADAKKNVNKKGDNVKTNVRRKARLNVRIYVTWNWQIECHTKCQSECQRER
jgi:hypothetical protein